MNIATNITKAPASPSTSSAERTRIEKDVATAEAMRGLEYDVYSVTMVSIILDDILEYEFKAGMTGVSPSGNAVLTSHQRENITFLAADLRDRIHKLDRAFQAALRGEVMQ